MSQPTAMCPLMESSAPPASSARSTTTVLATESARPNTSGRAGGPPPEQRQGHAQPGGDGDLHDGAGNGDFADRQQIVEREMQPDPEHQQHDADLGELGGKPTSATKPGVAGPMMIPASR